MKLRFNRYENEKTFRSPEDFVRFAEEQSKKYKGLEKSNPPAFQQWGRHLHSGWDAAAATARGDGATQATIQQRLNSSPVVPFSSLLRRRLEIMTDGDRGSEVHAALTHLLTGQLDGQRGNNVSVKVIQSYAELLAALSIEETLKKPNTKKWLADALKDHEEKLALLLEKDLEELEAKRQAFQDMLDTAAEDHKSLAQDAAATMAQHKADWEQARHDYLEQLKTETAVELWSERSKTHKENYKTFRSWTIGFGVVGLLLSLLWIFVGFAGVRWMLPDDVTAQVSSYVAGSVVIFTLFVWGLRVLVRSMMSEDHLSTDASARSAMAHTYLALIKQDAATDSDRTIILASLFAPVSDGIVKDDGMPVLSPAALAAHSLTNPKSG